MLLHYIRHGDPIYNPDSLTPLGYQQADAVKKRLGVHGIDKIYASSSKRAILTAQPTADMLNKEINILDWCNEKYAWQDFSVLAEDGGRTWAVNHDETREFFVSDELQSYGKSGMIIPNLQEHGLKRGFSEYKKRLIAFCTR